MLVTTFFAKFFLKNMIKRVLAGESLSGGEISHVRELIDYLGDGDGVLEFQDVIDALLELL